jgi:hypothetical protein
MRIVLAALFALTTTSVAAETKPNPYAPRDKPAAATAPKPAPSNKVVVDETPRRRDNPYVRDNPYRRDKPSLVDPFEPPMIGPKLPPCAPPPPVCRCVDAQHQP